MLYGLAISPINTLAQGSGAALGRRNSTRKR
jgi:hypothetical protein